MATWGVHNVNTAGVDGALLGDADDAFGMSSSITKKLGPTLSTEKTLEGWLRITEFDGGGALQIAGYCGRILDIAIDASGNIDALGQYPSIPNPVLADAINIDDGQWHHVVLVGSVQSMDLWVDGVIVGRALTGSPIRTCSGVGTQELVWLQAPGSSFESDLDEVAIYGRALSPQQIQDHYVASGRQPAVTLLEMFGPNDALRNCTCVTAHEGDPIDVASGNLHMPLPAVAVPGRGPGLGVPVAYNSLASDVDSSLGFGWSSLLDMRVDIAPGGKAATVVQETGATVPFTKDGTDWVAPERFVATLETSGTDLVFRRGHFESFRFDSVGRLVEIFDTFGNSTTLAYTGTSSEIDFLQDEAGRKLTLTWVGGRVTEIEDPLTVPEGGPRVAVFGYDGNGDLVSYTDLSGGVWTFTYEDHRLRTMRKPRHQPSGPVLENGYDDHGRVIWQDDELDRRTQIGYDGAGLDTTVVTWPGGRKRLHRFEDGLRVETIESFDSATDPEVSTKMGFDPDTYALTSIEDNDGNVTTFTDVDGDGNVDQVKDPTGLITEFTYNAFDQVEDVTTGKKDTGSGVVAPEGTITNRMEYHPTYGRLERTTVAVEVSGQEAVTEYFYDDAGGHPDDLVKIVDDRDKEWLFGYDAGTGDLRWSENPDGERTERTYTTIGWPKTVTTPKGVATPGVADDYRTVYEYDIAARTAEVIGPEGDKTRTVLDANGNTSSVTTGITDTDPGDTTTYHYTDAGELERVDHPDSESTAYTYRPDGLLETVTNELDAEWVYGYDDAGRLTSETDPNERVTAYRYDDASRLHQVLQPLDGASPTCDAPAVGCITYSYDDAGRPTGTDYSDASSADVTDIDYDSFGRRTEAVSGGVTESWEWNRRSQLVSHTDANGATTGYGWDGVGNLTSITYPGGTEQQFTWSADGGLPLLLAEHQGTDTTYLIYGPGRQPIAQINPDGTTRWYHHDQLGSIRLTTNATNGAQASIRSFDAYGTAASETGPQPLLGYAGQYTDAETGYQYLRARYYDPVTSQFLTRDPAVALTRDPYAYASANPSALTDPTGLWPWDGRCVDLEGIGNMFGRDWDDPSCDSIAEQNPEVSQATVNVAGGVVAAHPMTAPVAGRLDLQGAGVNVDSTAYRASRVGTIVVGAVLGFPANSLGATFYGSAVLGGVGATALGCTGIVPENGCLVPLAVAGTAAIGGGLSGMLGAPRGAQATFAGLSALLSIIFC